jgi:hypothetical protein
MSRTVVNLRLLTKNNKNKIDKKSGRKQPRANDYEATVVEPAPDGDFVLNTPITPLSVDFVFAFFSTDMW